MSKAIIIQEDISSMCGNFYVYVLANTKSSVALSELEHAGLCEWSEFSCENFFVVKFESEERFNELVKVIPKVDDLEARISKLEKGEPTDVLLKVSEFIENKLEEVVGVGNLFGAYGEGHIDGYEEALTYLKKFIQELT